MKKKLLLAAFNDYKSAHKHIQELHQAGYNQFNVLFLSRQGDQNSDGIEGFYPMITPSIQTISDSPVQGEIEVPQINSLPGENHGRVQVTVPDRLQSYGVPEGLIHKYTTLLQQGKQLAVVRDDQQLDNLAAMIRQVSIASDLCESVNEETF